MVSMSALVLHTAQVKLNWFVLEQPAVQCCSDHSAIILPFQYFSVWIPWMHTYVCLVNLYLAVCSYNVYISIRVFIPPRPILFTLPHTVFIQLLV